MLLLAVQSARPPCLSSVYLEVPATTTARCCAYCLIAWFRRVQVLTSLYPRPFLSTCARIRETHALFALMCWLFGTGFFVEFTLDSTTLHSFVAAVLSTIAGVVGS